MPSAIPKGAFSPQRQFIYMFALTLLIQTLHMMEHVAQVLQKFVFHIVPAHGLIGQLDLEPVHFAFNLFYLATLFIVLIGWLYYGSDVTSKHLRRFGFMILATLLVQGYHMLETHRQIDPVSANGDTGGPGDSWHVF